MGGGGGERERLISNGNLDPPLLEQGVEQRSQNGQKVKCYEIRLRSKQRC